MKLKSRHNSPGPAVAVSLHATERHIVVGVEDGAIDVFAVSGKHAHTFKGHEGAVWALASCGVFLASGGADSTLRVWNVDSGECLHTLPGHTSTIRAVEFNHASTAVTASRDSTLRVWDLTTGTCTHVLVGHQNTVTCLNVEDGIAVSGSYDGTAKVWDISTGECIHTLSGDHKDKIAAIARIGSKIATGAADGRICIWNAESGARLALLQGHTSLVSALVPRGKSLVSAGADGGLSVWHLEPYRLGLRFTAHGDGAVTGVAFVGSNVVTGGSDGTVKVWAAETAKLLDVLEDSCDAVWGLASVPGADSVALSLSRDGMRVLEVWR